MYIRVYELNLLIYDNDDDGFLEYKNIFFFLRYNNKYFSSSDFKKIFTHWIGWCLDFFFFFLASIFFTKSIVTVLKSFMKLERAGTSIRTVMFPRTLEYSSNRSNNTVSILIKILCRKWWLLLAPKKKERRGRKEGKKKKKKMVKLWQSPYNRMKTEPISKAYYLS